MSNHSQIEDRVLAILRHLALEPEAILETSALYPRLVNLLRDEAGYGNCALMVPDATGHLVKVAAVGHRTNERKRAYPLSCDCLASGRTTDDTFLISDVEAVPMAKRCSYLGKGSLLVALLRSGPEANPSQTTLVGAFLLEHENTNAFAESDCEFMHAIAPYCAAALEIARRCHQAQEMAHHDDLTGLHNRRFFQESLQRELKRASRTGRPVSLAIIDLDKLKRVNDTYGHIMGDNVLRIVAQVLAKSVRSYDVLARYGGDEFVLVMPETKLTDAERILRRLAATSDRARLDHLSHNTLLPSYSYGFATFPQDGKTFEEVFAVADKRLYQAKARKGITS
ncbi:MAG: GGDEF domain-containing protein [Chloroflexi bacterium]|nr:GGDEF domain-containing protein [Chloroflexota bacterium]